MMTRRVTIASTLLLAIGLSGWMYQSIQQAREAARRVAFKSHLYQHSGSHPGISVNVDDTGTIVSIGICPTCYEENSPVLYYLKRRDGYVRIEPSEELACEASDRIEAKLTDPEFVYRRARWNRFQSTSNAPEEPSAELD